MLLALSLSCAFTGKAQIIYRGFIEGGLGTSIIGGAFVEAFVNENSKPHISEGFENSNKGGGIGFGYMLATTHGIQKKNNFFGIGFGITPAYCAVGSYYAYTDNRDSSVQSVSNSRISKVSIPTYFNWRYDFFSSNSTFKPYVGIKVGVFIPMTEFEWEYKTTYHTFTKKKRSDYSPGLRPYAAIDLGLRKRISEYSGISFGLSIQNSSDIKVNWEYTGSDYCWSHGEDNFGISFLAKVAFDF